jgi:L-ribulose-5-phosphate 3-epimerase UlaE
MAARERLSQMEFSEQTIYEVLHHFMQNKDQILGECIMDVFKQVTNFSRDNVIKHEQWATNKSWKIGTKIIVPYSLDVYFDWRLSSRREDFLNDLDKAITMFGGTNGICTITAIKAVLERILSKEMPYTGKFETPNFHFRVYKKGTLHLWFRDLKALELMNRYAAERDMFTLGSGK